MNAFHIELRDWRIKKTFQFHCLEIFFIQNFAFTIYAFFSVAYLFYKSYNWLGGQWCNCDVIKNMLWSHLNGNLFISQCFFLIPIKFVIDEKFLFLILNIIFLVIFVFLYLSFIFTIPLVVNEGKGSNLVQNNTITYFYERKDFQAKVLQ